MSAHHFESVLNRLWNWGTAALARPGITHRRRQRWNGVEMLEDRWLLSGIVSSTFVNGSLALKGDAAANDISLQFEAGRVRITGNAGTKIQGRTLVPVTGNISMNLGSGSDIVTLSEDLNIGYAVGSIRIVDGAGFNKVEMNGIRARGAVWITTGSGQDQIRLNDIKAGSISINTGDGNDKVSFGGLQSENDLHLMSVRGNFMIDTGAGQDKVDSYGNPLIGGLTQIRTGAGGDIVDLTGGGSDELTPFNRLVIDTGSEDDTVTLEGVQPRATTINTGTGNDIINFGGANDGPVAIRGALTVNAGAGNDSINVGGLRTPPIYGQVPGDIGEFLGPVTFNMGDGSDFVIMDSSSFAGSVTLNMGQGRDTVIMGKYTGGLSIDGPLLLNMGGNNDVVSIGLPGLVHPDKTGDIDLLAWTHLNGPTRIIGGAGPTQVIWHSGTASFNGGLKLTSAKLIKKTVNKTQTVESTKLTINNGSVGTFSNLRNQTFVTNYALSRDKNGTVTMTPVLTTLSTGLRLDIGVKISADLRSVTLDVNFLKTLIDSVGSVPIMTPFGKQNIQVPVVSTISAHSKVTAFDGGTVVIGGLSRNTSTVTNNQGREQDSNLQLQLTPRIIIDEDNHALSVTVGVQLIETIDPDVAQF